MPSQTPTHNIDLLTTTLTHIPRSDLTPLKPTLTDRTTALLSHPFPPTTPSQISLFHSLLRHQDAYSHLKWQHPSLNSHLANLGALIIRTHTAKPPHDSNDTQSKLWADIEVLRILPLIKKRCALDPSAYALLNTRLREMRDEVQAFLVRASQNENSASVDKRLVALGRVSEFRGYWVQEGGQVDGRLDTLIRGYAHDIVSRPGTAAVDSSLRTRVGKEEKTSSASPNPPNKREELVCSTPVVTTAPKQKDPALPPSESASKPAEPPGQNPLAALFAERAAREEARQQHARDAQRAEARAKAKARQDAIANDPARAVQRKHAEEMKAKREKDAAAKKNVLAKIEADKELRREKAEMTRLRRLQDVEAQKAEEKAKHEEMEAKEQRDEAKARKMAENRFQRVQAGMSRLGRLQELETQKEERKAKTMKKNEEATSSGAPKMSRRQKARMNRLQELERRSEEEEAQKLKEQEAETMKKEKAKKLKEKEVTAKLSALDRDMEFDDMWIEATDDEDDDEE